MRTLSLCLLLLLFSAANSAYRDSYIYCSYDGSGDQDDPANYTVQSTIPPTCPGAARLYWFKVLDINGNGKLDQVEIDATIDVLDTDNDGSLDDEAEIPGVLEKKF